MGYFVGIDLGGTDIKAGVLDAQAMVRTQTTIPTEAARGPDHVIPRIAELASRVISEAGLTPSDIRAIGVGIPGPIDPERNVVLSAPNLNGWVNIPLHQRLTELLTPPVTVMNDADAAAYGEYWIGAGRSPDVRHLVLLTLGTGVGGGVIVDGHLYGGAHGAGSELGHTIIEPMGLRCGCGQRGCLEQYASATAIAAEAHRRIEAGAPTQMRGKPTAKDVFAAAAAGDAVAADVVNRTCEYLGVASVNFVRAFDPRMIVLGGGVAKAGAVLVEGVRRAFEARTWHVRKEKVVFAAATLGNQAGFIGAAGMAADACGALATH